MVPGMGDEMAGTVWVGRVKSGVNPETLERAFEQFGAIKALETGFPGFAFVHFAEAAEADQATRSMNNHRIPGVGQILAKKATQRGYQDALAKRDAYNSRGTWRRAGGTTLGAGQGSSYRGDAESVHGDEGHGRSPLKRGVRSRSRSSRRSGSWKRASRARSPSRLCQRRRSLSRGRSPAERSREKSERGEEGTSQPSRRRRQEALCFFDGANLLDLWLEALSAAGNVDVLNGFPFAFDGLPQQEALDAISMASDFADAGEASNAAERSVEVRQAISIVGGKRFLRKAIFVNGQHGYSEHQELT